MHPVQPPQHGHRMECDVLGVDGEIEQKNGDGKNSPRRQATTLKRPH